MAKKIEIEIEIDENTGNLKMETFCIEGSECENILDKFQSLIGAEKIDNEDKPEKRKLSKISNRNRERY